MLTAEIKVNGSPIGHVYARNCGRADKDLTTYECEVYEPGVQLHRMTIKHKASNGWGTLLHLILKRWAKGEK